LPKIFTSGKTTDQIREQIFHAPDPWL